MFSWGSLLWNVDVVYGKQDTTKSGSGYVLPFRGLCGIFEAFSGEYLSWLIWLCSLGKKFPYDSSGFQGLSSSIVNFNCVSDCAKSPPRSLCRQTDRSPGRDPGRKCLQAGVASGTGKGL